jgi:pSer/pThr/pTyr-binding forkhead associated (FHA) protein
MYKLIIEDDEGKTTVVPLIRDEITIGRKEGNTIRLTERNVSRRHAKLLKNNGSIFIEDLSSYNGIKINGDRIAGRAPINEGDRIQIGDYQLALKLDKQQQQGAPAGELQEGVKTAPFVKAVDGNGAAPAQVMDMAPTVQTPIVSPAQATAAREDAAARLVVVSSNFAGQEFVLDKAAVVIGRTDENDIVINHRSISRHHAKIVRENGHYHIVDLQSANGVRVNGEEYGKVELRKGDHIDLGHVRLRFVAPGEDFLFDRDAQIVDVGGGRKSRAGLVAALILVVMALVGGAVALVKLGAHGPTVVGENGPHAADAEAQVAKLLLEADKALKQEDWDLATAKCDEALKLDPAQELARDKRTTAESEKKNRVAYQAFVAAADKNDMDSAVASYGEVAQGSMYLQKGSERYAQVKKTYLRNHLEAARKARQANRCEDARQHVEAALTVDEGNQEAQDIIKSCGATMKPVVTPTPPKPHNDRPEKDKEPKVAVAPKVKPEKDKEPPKTSTSDDPPVSDTPPVNNAAAEKLYQEAQDAYVHGQYTNAIELAVKLKKMQPGKAWRIIGASNCFLKDRSGAMSAYSKLDPTGRQFLKYVCSRNAITIP